jgi:hypothetical protein
LGDLEGRKLLTLSAFPGSQDSTTMELDIMRVALAENVRKATAAVEALERAEARAASAEAARTQVRFLWGVMPRARGKGLKGQVTPLRPVEGSTVEGSSL